MAEARPGEHVLSQATRNSLLVGVIRLGGVGLSFAFFLAIARASPAEAFGNFSVLFALATLLGYCANIGQHVAIIRFWPSVEARSGRAAADAILGRSLGLALGGGAAGAALIAALGLYAPIAGLTDNTANLVIAGLLTFVMAARPNLPQMPCAPGATCSGPSVRATSSGVCSSSLSRLPCLAH